MLPAVLLLKAAAKSFVRRNLTDELNIDDSQDSPTIALAGVRLNTDGTVDKNLWTAYVQIHAASDWIIPNSKATDQYWVRCTINSGSNNHINASVEDVWHQMTTWRTFGVQRESIGVTSFDYTIELATDSGGSNIVASANYTGSAEMIF